MLFFQKSLGCRIRFRMYTGGIQRIFTIADTQKACTLLICLGIELWYL